MEWITKMKYIRHIIIIVTVFILSYPCVGDISGLGKQSFEAINIKVQKIHNNPDAHSKEIGILKYNQHVEIVDEAGSAFKKDNYIGKWCQIKCGNEKGWVFSGFLIRKIPDSLNVKKMKKGDIYYLVEGNGAKFGPDMKYIIYPHKYINKYNFSTNKTSTIYPISGLSPSLSPDGSKIVLQSYGYNQHNDISYSLWELNTNGKNPIELSDPNKGKIEHQYPQYSPTGKYIAFLCDSDVCIMNSDGKNIKKIDIGLSYESILPQCWYSGNQLIVKVKNVNSPDTCLWIVDVDSMEKKPFEYFGHGPFKVLADGTIYVNGASDIFKYNRDVDNISDVMYGKPLFRMPLIEYTDNTIDISVDGKYLLFDTFSVMGGSWIVITRIE